MGFFPGRLFGYFDNTVSAPRTFPDEQPETFDIRRAHIIKWWTYYHGADSSTGRTQWSYLYERFETLANRDLEDIENHTRICTDRLRRLLVNSWRGFEFDNENTGNRITDILNRNRWPHLFNLAALYGKVTGDVFLKLAHSQPESRFGPVRIILLDSESVELDVSPHDRNDVRAVTVAYDFFEKDSGGNGTCRRRKYREIIDAGSVTAFIDGEYAPEYSYDHNLGFIPVVHIRNLDSGGGVYGESYVGRLVNAQDSINLLASDLMDIVRYDGHKTTIFQNVNIDKGASRDGATSGEVDLSIGKGLVVKGDGKVYKLDNQHDLGAALEEYDRKLDAFYDLATVPRLSKDMVSHLGDLSGKAIERLYQDAIESTREAQGLYGESLRELINKIAVMAGLEPCEVKAVWNADVISADIETLAREHEIGARSIRSVMRKLGIRDVEQMRKELEDEKENQIL